MVYKIVVARKGELLLTYSVKEISFLKQFTVLCICFHEKNYSSFEDRKTYRYAITNCKVETNSMERIHAQISYQLLLLHKTCFYQYSSKYTVYKYK